MAGRTPWTRSSCAATAGELGGQALTPEERQDLIEFLKLLIGEHLWLPTEVVP